MPESSPPIAAEAVEALAAHEYHREGAGAYSDWPAWEQRSDQEKGPWRDIARENLEAALPAIWNSFEEALLGEEAVRAAAIKALPEAFPAPPAPDEEPDWLDEDVEWAENVTRSALQAALKAIRGEQ